MLKIKSKSHKSPALTSSGMLWLVASQILVLLIYIGDVPIWLIPIAFLTAAWRIRQIRHGLGHTPWYLILLLIGLGIGGLILSGHTRYELDSAVALAVLGYSLKNVEANYRQDAIFSLMLGYLLVGFSFLYHQTIFATLLAIVAATVLTAAFIGVQMLPGHKISLPFRLATKMILMSAPLMVCLFLVIPRLPPLWAIPVKSGQGVTGMSDEVGFGDIANLARTSERAFRVDFTSAIPPRDQWYWRGLVYTNFDGARWRQSATSEHAFFLHVKPRHWLSDQDWMFETSESAPYDYQVLLEKTNQRWLFTLDLPVQYDTRRFRRYTDFRLVAKQEILSPMQYQVTSHGVSQLGPDLSPWEKTDALALPPGLNPKTRQWSERQRSEAGSDAAFIQRVLHYLQSNPYFYTLQPGVLTSRNRVDEFLFESRRGFCTHYASSFVVMMRSVGIPARMVGGYLGGEWNTVGDYMVVRQTDAHAWAEVWLPDKGWVRVDPTAAIAPSRVEQTLQDLMPDSFRGTSALAIGLNQIDWINRIRQRLDHVQFYWQRWVLNYHYRDQTSLLRSLLGTITTTRIMVLFGTIIVGFLVISSWLIGVIQWPKAQPLEQRLWCRFRKVLERQGLAYHPHETIGQYCQRAAHTWPHLTSNFHDIQQTLERLYYNTGSPQSGTLQQLKTSIKQLKKKRLDCR